MFTADSMISQYTGVKASHKDFALLKAKALTFKVKTRDHKTVLQKGLLNLLHGLARVKYFRLKFFGHLARSAQEEDHHCVISAALHPPSDWRRPIGRPRTTWLRTIDEDIQPQNFGVHTAWRKARDREVWHQVSTATLC